MEQSSTEEQWNFRQKSAALEAERVSFEREKSFTREKLATEEKRIQVPFLALLIYRNKMCLNNIFSNNLRAGNEGNAVC